MAVAFTIVLGALRVCNGTEGHLHKDWAIISARRTTVAEVAYDDGPLHIHPFLLLHLTFTVNDVGRSSAAYRAISMGSYNKHGRGIFSDVLEALSMGNLAMCKGCEV